MSFVSRLPRPLSTALAVTLVAGVSMGLAACDTVSGVVKKEAPVCPDLRIDRDTARITVFDPRGTDLTDVVFEARIADINGDCSFAPAAEGEGGVVDAKFKVLFAVTRGPAMDGRQGHFTYFVALPAFYPSPAAKQALRVDFAYPEGNMTTMMVRDEEVEVALPVASRQAAGDQAIYVGFQLTPEQLEFNRANRP